MSEQLDNILMTTGFIKSEFPKNFKPSLAIITEKHIEIQAGFKILGEISYDKLYAHNENLVRNAGKVVFTKCEGRDILIYSGRFHYFGGVNMRDIGHMIYVLRYLGINNIISIDEVGHLNPRFNCGEIALIYDHINLIGDNPLIGKNDAELGLRFPDMSNAYDKELYKKVFKIFQEKFIKINESVYLGTTGPQSETDAEARFYREIGADVVGYSLVPENITAVHAGLGFIGIGLITRELVADKMMEDDRSDKQRISDQKAALKIAVKELGKVLKDIVKKI
ncbi:MAG TPA: purine-nucleoside phosphorylase [Ignavibacteria bacterium]|nr:purine-nucleoside phosphorylase [Ignavibacteria bacterium]